MILDAFIQPKRFFNENSKEDIRVAREFFQNWSWGADTCPFVLEQPYVSIPEMMRDRVLNKMLKLSEK